MYRALSTLEVGKCGYNQRVILVWDLGKRPNEYSVSLSQGMQVLEFITFACSVIMASSVKVTYTAQLLRTAELSTII
jgi:hypothetical protein